MSTQRLCDRAALTLVSVAALLLIPLGLDQTAASGPPKLFGSHIKPAISLDASGITQTTIIAQSSRVRRVKFAPGKFSTTLEDAVVRGTRDIYLLGASKGQTMSVKIASVENNAVFDVATPSNKAGQRRTLKQEAVNWSGVLPASGDYQIIVGGTRGNASYKLQVAIK